MRSYLRSLCLGSDNVDTYWQSDGGQPHLINIQFHKKVSIIEVAFYLDYKLDESYTPKKLSIRAGTTFHDLVEIHVMELSEPTGWVSVPLHMMDEENAQVRRTTDASEPAFHFSYCFMRARAAGPARPFHPGVRRINASKRP